MGGKKAKTQEKVFLDSFDLEALFAPNGISDDEMDGYSDAMDMIFNAYEQRSKPKRIAMAKKALALSPYVVDAHILLINEELRDTDERITACLAAIELGKKFVGEESLEDYHGELWMNMDARPTMRALHVLALLYLDKGDLKQAIDTCWSMLDMNVNDNQGIRELLLPALIEAQDWEGAQKLYKKYKDAFSAAWHYQGALADWAQKKKAAAGKKLDKAHAQNPHFLPYMTGAKPLPGKREGPPYYSPGTESEAVAFIKDVHKSWHGVPGAVDWLRGHPFKE